MPKSSQIFKNHGYVERMDVNNANLAAGMYYGTFLNAPKSYGTLLVLGSGAAWYTSQILICWSDDGSFGCYGRKYQSSWSSLIAF